MKRLLNYLDCSVIELVFTVVLFIAVSFFGVAVLNHIKTNKNTVNSLQSLGYSEVKSTNVAGSYIYTFTDSNGHKYRVGENAINKYLK